MLKREASGWLNNWRLDSSRKPLIVMGARQVGKTFLIKDLGKKEYQNLIYLNFESQKDLKSLFYRNLEANQLIKLISVYANQEFNPKTTLCFLDEIQACPEAITSLKYFNEQAPEYHIIVAGSLLGVRLAGVKPFPVGKVQFLDLYSLNFREFLMALGENNLLKILVEHNSEKKIPEALHTRLCNLLKLYTFTGGMPACVAEYVSTKNLIKIREIQELINRSYLFDFSKYADSTMAVRISEIWQSLPAQLAKESKKFLFSAVKKSARGREYYEAVQWLIDAGLVVKVKQTAVPNLPLDVYAANDIYKLYIHDTGLLGAMLGLTERSLLLTPEVLAEFNGALAENIVAQQLINNNIRPLYYWVSAGSAEVDFLFSFNDQIFPLEVKAGLNLKQKSLNLYNQKYSPDKIIRTSLANYDRKGNLVNIPLYALSEIKSELLRET